MIAALLAVMLAAAVLAGSLFVVGQGDSALCARFGRLQPQTYGPGLHWKWPVDHVLRFDQRLVTHVYPGESFLTADQRSLNIDFLLRLRVSDAMAFYQSAGGDEDAAAQRLADATRDRLKATVAGESLVSVSSMERGGLSAQGFQALQATARGMGLALVDLQLQRIDLSDQAADAVYSRMEQDFNTRAQGLDASGALQADQIRADAERKRAQTLADGARDAQRIRADADAKTAILYAHSYGRNPELAAFVQSLAAYKSSLGQEGDLLVITPEGDFFKYLHSPSGDAAAAGAAIDIGKRPGAGNGSGTLQSH
jgi:membrane protease subunit HflC